MKSLLVGVLIVSALIEGFLSGAGLFAPEWMLGQFKIGVTGDTLFMGYVLAWLMLLVTAACGWAVGLVGRGERAGWTLSMALGLWWFGIGIGLALKFGRLEHLALDSAKGALLFVAAWRSRKV